MQKDGSPNSPAPWLWRTLSAPKISAGAVLFMMAVVTSLCIGPAMLRGTDAAVYCQVAKEWLNHPGPSWATLTLDGEEFFEHPPGLMLVLTPWFKAFGATTLSAVWAARTLMALVVVATSWTALTVAGPPACVGTLIGFCLQSGFWFEANNPMLELPTNCALCLGTWALVQQGAVAGQRGGARGLYAALATVAFAAAPLFKGPVGLLAWPLAACLAAIGLCSIRAARNACVLGLTLTLACVMLWEGSRAWAGQPSFVARYLTHQVWPSMVHGRHNPVASYFYYGPYLVRWYGAGLGLLLLTWLQTLGRRGKAPNMQLSFKLLQLATLWVSCVVVGFSCMQQKYQWYIHVALPAFALMGGVALAQWAASARLWARTAQAGATVLALSVTCAWVALRLHPPSWLAPKETPCFSALYQLAPLQPASDTRRPTLACCLDDAGWRSRYVALFVHGVRLVPCGEPADVMLGADALSGPTATF